MSLKGFISAESLEDGNVEEIATTIVKELMSRGQMKLRGITVSNVSGYMWEIEDPEVKRLMDTVKDLENSNSRLYRHMAESYDRRSGRLGVE